MKPWTRSDIDRLSADLARLRAALPPFRLLELDDGHLSRAKAKKVAPFLWTKEGNAGAWAWNPKRPTDRSSQRPWRRPAWHELDVLNTRLKAAPRLSESDRVYVNSYAADQYLAAKARERYRCAGWFSARWVEFLEALGGRQ